MLNCAVIPSALLYALISQLAYEDYRTVQTTVGNYGLHAISLFDSRKTDTEGFVVRNHESCLRNNPSIRRVTIVVFRGTEVKSSFNLFFNPRDVFTNLGIRMVRVVGPRHASYKVHRGFYKAYRSVHYQVNDILMRHTSPGDSVVFTGHSLGGALATIAAFYRPTSSTFLVTFGAPPIGNSAFAHFFYRWPHYQSKHFVMNGDAIADQRSSGLVAFLRRKRYRPTPWHISLPGVGGLSHDLSSYISMLRRYPQ